MGKVLFVIERLCGGGAERALSNIVTHFPQEWQVDILVDDESLIEYPYKGNLMTLSCPEKNSTLHFIMSMIKRTIYLRKIKKRNGYSACISFLEGANISNILSGKKYCRSIVSLRNQIMPDKAGSYQKLRDFLLTKLLFERADKIVAVSEEIALDAVHRLKIPENKVQAIVNGYDFEWIRSKMGSAPFFSAFNENRKAGGRKLVVTVGRLVEQKGQWHLIRAFSEVVEKCPQAILAIVGEGPFRGYLTELIHACGLEEKVILAGRSDNPFQYLGAADVFVLSSLWEGYPNALAEAICCGVPCIAADVHSGSREILAPGMDAAGERVCETREEEYGILVPVCSGKLHKKQVPLEREERELAEAVTGLLEDTGKRDYYRKKSLERGKMLDIDRIVEKWIEIIEVRQRLL